MRPKAFLFATLLLLPLWAEAEDPQTTRGIDPAGVFHVNDIDNVNLFNGNVIISVPLAAQFPLNGGFSYAIHLVYNGQPWDFPETTGDQGPDVYKPSPVPNRRSNAGMGWRVTMGGLISPSDPSNPTCPDNIPGVCVNWIYESPDGADHYFWPTGGVYYTSDGSYLRMKDYVTYLEVEFPDGVIHRFNGTDGTLSAIYTPFDRAANGPPSVTIAYLSNVNNVCGANADSCWQINDTVGRTQYVTFRNTSHLAGHQVAQSIIVTAPGGYQVTYALRYNNNGPAVLYDPAFDIDLMLDASGACYTRWPVPSDMLVPILTSIGLPDGSQYKLDTYQDNPPGCNQGSIKTLTLPTLGSVSYVYTKYFHNGIIKTRSPYVPGVKQRTKTDAGGVAQTWTYAPVDQNPADTFCAGCPGNQHFNRERVLTLTDPENRQSHHYFSIAESDQNNGHIDPAGWNLPEMGLPFTRTTATVTTDPSTGEPRYLSSEVLDGGGNVERSNYVTYALNAEAGSDTGEFRRESASLTKYGYPDAARWSSTIRSEFDGFGHYRKTVTDGNFAVEGATGLDQRTEYVDFNPGIAATINPNPSTWPGSSWVLNTFDYQWTNAPRINPNDGAEPAFHTKKTEFCFESGTGFLSRTRVLANDATAASGITQGTSDLITVFGHDSTGNLTSEKSYGGDTPYDGTQVSVPTGALCDISPSGARYEIQHTYQNGVRATSQYYSSGTAMPFNTLDRTIDLSGAVSSEKDVSQVPTTYTPDPADPLRIKWIATPGTATINYTYAPASNGASFSPAQITIAQSDVTTLVQYDSFGRLWREFRTMPEGQAQRETLYDPSGRKLSQSVWDMSSPPSYSRKTTFHYDFLGRLDSVDPPDHQTVTTSYTGDSTRATTANVFMALDPTSAQTAVTTTEQMDRYGRLWYVNEPNGTVTAYGYGVTGALRRVCMNATLTGGGLSTATCGQERKFSYDNRGFLTSETHPENGTITYSYDARGHVLTKRPATAGTQFDVNYTYDDAERLKQIDSRNSTSTFHASKEFTYGVANVSGNLTLGKPATAVRHNYQTNGDDYRVTESYTYNDTNDPAGRLTDRSTEVRKPDGSVLQAFSQRQTYTLLGQPASVTYPTCQGSVLCGAASSDTVTAAYANGLLSSITGFGSLTYHPSGMVKTVSHANGVTDTYAIDDTTGVPRPKSIAFATFASCTQPTITSQPGSPTIQQGNSATLSVSASPASVTFQWHDADGTPLAGQTGSVFTTPVLNADHSYFVRVSNSCGLVTSVTATVHVSTGSVPVITIQPQSTTAAQATLTVAVTGTAPFTYQWYQGPSGVTTTRVGTNNSYFNTPVLTVTTKYWVQVSNGFGSANSNVATVTVPLGTPSSLVATMTSSTSIQLNWTGVSGTNIHYEIWRRDHGSNYYFLTTSSNPPFSDTGLSTVTTYVYQVRALDANNESASSFSNPDLATTITFTPLGNGSILFAHFNELLTAVNAMRRAYGWSTLAWSDISPGNVPAVGTTVLGSQVMALRQYMDSVYRQLIGTPPPYTDPMLPGSPKVFIKWLHVTELRSRVQ
jgi:YD repeat-containing protein